MLKGLPAAHVILGTCCETPCFPTITVVGVQVGYLVGGLVVVETLFSYPGIGQLILNAGHRPRPADARGGGAHDRAHLHGGQPLADVLYAVLNPRVRLAT